MAEVYVSSKGADLALARGQELNFSDDQLPDQLFSGEMVIPSTGEECDRHC